MVVRKGTEGVGTIKRTPVKSKSPSLFTGRAARGKITIIESKTPGGEAKAVAVDPSKISRQEAIAEAKAGRIIATEEGAAKITKGQQRELRAQAEAPVREKFKRQFEEAHERVAQKELIASRDKGIRGKLRRDLPQFISAVKEEFPKEEVTSPGFLTTSKTDLARRALLVGTKETRVELAKKEQSVLAGVTHRALGIPQFGLEHPVITGGIVLAAPVAAAAAGAAGISAGVVATAGEVAIIGLGAVQTGLGIQEFRSAETPFEKGAAGFDIVAGVTQVAGGAALRLRRLTGPKVTGVDSLVLAKEVPKVDVDDATRFQIAAEPKVKVKQLFTRPKEVTLQVGGESIVTKSVERPGLFEARTGFAVKGPDAEDIISIGKTKELISVQDDFIKSISATEVRGPKGADDVSKFVSSQFGFKGPAQPVALPTNIDDLSVVLSAQPVKSLGQTVPITGGKVGDSIQQRTLSLIIKQPKTEPKDFGFGLKVFTQQKQVPSPTFTGLESAIEQTAIKTITGRVPTTIAPPPTSLITSTPSRAPQVTRQAPPSTITQQIAPQQIQQPRVREQFLLKTQLGVAQKAGVTPSSAFASALRSELIPTQIITPAQATQVGTQAIVSQVPFIPTPTQQRTAQAFAEPVPQPIAPLFGLPKGSGSKQLKAKRPPGLRVKGAFPASLVAVEFGITATAAERKRIEKTGLGVLGVRPLVTSPRRKKKK